MELFLISENIRLEFAENQLWVIQPGKKSPVNLLNIQRIWTHTDIDFPAVVLEAILTQEVELVIRNEAGSPLGFLCPWVNPRGTKGRQFQVLFALSKDAQSWMAHWLYLKHCRQLEWLTSIPNLQTKAITWTQLLDLQKQQEKALERSEVLPEDMKEAYFSRLYYKMINTILPSTFQFDKRSRQPAQDPYNALLNYAYGILYGITEGALRRAGLDPYIGFLHQERDGAPVLVYDFIEAYRPWADQVCVQLCLEQKVSPKNFKAVDQGIWLGNTGKSILIQAFMDFLDQTPKGKDQRNRTRKEQIFKAANDLQKLIAGWSPPNSLLP